MWVRNAFEAHAAVLEHLIPFCAISLTMMHVKENGIQVVTFKQNQPHNPEHVNWY